MTIGIDATNLRRGGGITHLAELLRAVDVFSIHVKKVVVWGGKTTLSALDERPWLEKRNPPELDEGIIKRTMWQCRRLPTEARVAGCDVIFVPGGSFCGGFAPIVTMSRNLLPFELGEMMRYGCSIFTLKLLLLRFTQSRSFMNAQGVIFLTEYARKTVLTVVGELDGFTCSIPHGLNQRFLNQPKMQFPISNYNDSRPLRVLYVSIIDEYKHQWNVIESISRIRRSGVPIVLDLVGPAYPKSLRRLNETIKIYDPENIWVNYYGAIPFDQLHVHYQNADIGVFASSCENMPNILLETMASGLPIACSKRGPMPEILGSGGVYFDPEKPSDISRAILELIGSPDLRTRLSNISYNMSIKYSWERCASETFRFIIDVANKSRFQKC